MSSNLAFVLKTTFAKKTHKKIILHRLFFCIFCGIKKDLSRNCILLYDRAINRVSTIVVNLQTVLALIKVPFQVSDMDPTGSGSKKSPIRMVLQYLLSKEV